MGCRGKTWPKERDFHAKLTMGIGVELGCCFFIKEFFSIFQSSFEFKQGKFKPNQVFGIFSKKIKL
jgi:hypothetical protein